MADDEMMIKIPVPSDSKGRIMLSDEQWSAHLNRAITEAAQRDSVNWSFDRVMGRDDAGNVVVRVRQEQPRENRGAAARSGNDRPDRAEVARGEAARRQAQREQTREQQRGGQGRDR